jgi:beta-lactamase regulating signal transducer with metallopeptidase domain
MTGLLLDHLWQSTLFASAVGLLTLALRRNGAQVRYCLWFAASLKFLVPFAALTAAGSYLLASLTPPVSAPSLLLLKPVAQPFSLETLAVSVIPVPAAGTDWAQILAPLLLAVWGIGCAAILARWLVRWSRLRRVLRSAVVCPLSAPVPVKMAPSLLEPGLVGIFRPVILVPQGITERLSQTEMDAILAHEICHLRRRDNLMAATHMLVEALFWFHPLVWWLGARLNTEREHACDESVLAAGQSPQVYAESILKVCQFYLHSPLDCAAGISGADLKIRMETIMKNQLSLRLNTAKKLLLAGAAILAIAAPMAMGLVASPPVLAQTVARTTPDPRTEAALRGQVEGFEKHKPAFAALASGPGGKYGGQYAMADFVRRNQAALEQKIDALGALKSIAFRGVEYATDYYTVEFANGWLIAGIALTPDGKVGNLEFIVRSNPNGPEPGTEAAIRQITSGLVKRQPPYDVLSPELAQEMRVPGGWLSQIMPAVIVLGPLKSLTFQNVTIDGRDQYEAIYDSGRASWTASPLMGGKMLNFGFRIGDPQNPTYAMAWNVGAEYY